MGAQPLVRPATAADLDAVAALTVDVYVGDGLMPAGAPYVAELSDAAARFAAGGLLVAQLEGAGVGDIVGAVTFATHGSPYAELAGPDEAEFRMLAVDRRARRRNVGRALVQECVAASYDARCSTLRLCTQQSMTAAQHLYAAMGFRRTPGRDWAPSPGVDLLAYALDLRAHDDGAEALEPPRRCGACGRRLVVQVLPQGWTARCSVHGMRSSAPAARWPVQDLRTG